MNKFTLWLTSEFAPQTKEVAVLLRVYREHSDAWRKAGDTKLAISDMLLELFPEDQEHALRLAVTLDSVWEQWTKQNIVRGGSGFWEVLLRNPSGAISVLVGIAFLGIMGHAFISETGVLSKVNDAATARGAITFLFAFGTIVLALMLVASTLFSAAANDNDLKYLKERFNQGKEVLTILIGILGTIVGFYFGALGNDTALSSRMELSEARVLLDTADKPSYFILSMTVSGGRPPYLFSLDFDEDSGIQDIPRLISPNGFIMERIQLPDGLRNNSENVVFEIEDGDGAILTQLKDIGLLHE